MNTVTKMILTLCIIGIVSGGALNSIWDWADPLIKENARIATEKAIFEVQPTGKTYKRLETDVAEIYQVFENDTTSVGYAVVCLGNGFQNKIKMMFGVDGGFTKITALAVLDQQETPGLGDEITKPHFTTKFEGINVANNMSVLKGLDGNKAEGKVQAITGATISSKAVVEIINGTLDKLRKIEGLGGVQ